MTKGGSRKILQNCPKCGGLFIKNVRKFCPECCVSIDEIYYRMKEYIEMFPKATSEEIIQALEIDASTLRYLRKEDRLTLS